MYIWTVFVFRIEFTSSQVHNPPPLHSQKSLQETFQSLCELGLWLHSSLDLQHSRIRPQSHACTASGGSVSFRTEFGWRATYSVLLRAIVLPTCDGLDVGLLRSWMDAVLAKGLHALACLYNISPCDWTASANGNRLLGFVLEKRWTSTRTEQCE
jgi:hypothetical protein